MVKDVLQQGTLIRLNGNVSIALILSREFFNQTGMVIACPVVREAPRAALNIKISTESFSGYAILSQLKSIDLTSRLYAVLGELPFSQIQNISDAVQDIFNYYPF